MYEVMMFDGGVYRIKEFYELVEDVGGFIIQKSQAQQTITVTLAIPEEEKVVIEKKSEELGGRLINVPLAGTEIAVVAPTLGRHHMPHPVCDIAEHLRRYGAITVVMGLARGKGRKTAQITADEKRIIEEYDAAVFVLGNFKDCIVEEKVRLFEEIEIPVAVVCGPELEELPSCEALVCGIGRKAERMRRAEEIEKLEETAQAVERIVRNRRKELDEDPLFVHPAEIKQAIEDLEPVQDNLRPAPIVLHLNGLRVKIPYAEWRDTLYEVEIYGRKLGEIANIRDASLTGSTLIEILTKCEVEDRDRKMSS
ncbi:MAG: methanogenesis marker 7 protein [Methanomassiliicoccales archaeon]|nr:methanogenesis marker 7 protein [Methanomassiliicoccales archaeon]NYT14981.1 methanogenesis marker 7 protein [Methanomassiliicoccales archaeon]